MILEKACWYLNSTAKQIQPSLQCSFKLVRVTHSVSSGDLSSIQFAWLYKHTHTQAHTHIHTHFQFFFSAHVSCQVSFLHRVHDQLHTAPACSSPHLECCSGIWLQVCWGGTVLHFIASNTMASASTRPKPYRWLTVREDTDWLQNKQQCEESNLSKASVLLKWLALHSFYFTKLNIFIV